MAQQQAVADSKSGTQPCCAPTKTSSSRLTPLQELLYKLFSAFSAPATASKFQMVRSGKVRSTMLALVSPDQLPAAYGGFQQEDVTWGDVQQARAGQGDD